MSQSAQTAVSISVIVRTLGRNEHLKAALESLSHQTLRDFEVVVVDMSARGVGSVVVRYRERLRSIQYLQIGKPLPRAEALNQGIRKASAAKISILDDDNLYDPVHLAMLVEGLEETGADLVYTGVRRTTYTDAGQLVDTTEWNRPYDFNELLKGNYIHTAGTGFWKFTWERHGGYDARFPVYEDYDFLLRVGATGRIAGLGAVTAESRSFTGKPGVQNHRLSEADHVRRCQAGLRWLHRDLFCSPEGSRATQAPLLVARQGKARHSRIRVLFQRLHHRGELLGDLLGWWWYHALPYRERR